jgi:hypothetical protein
MHFGINNVFGDQSRRINSIMYLLYILTEYLSVIIIVLLQNGCKEYDAIAAVIPVGGRLLRSREVLQLLEHGSKQRVRRSICKQRS